MNRIKDFRDQVIARCKDRGACKNEYSRLIAAQTPKKFIEVLRENHGWCIYNDIYAASEMLTVPADILLAAGIATQDSLPLDFTQPQELCGLKWMPFNEGASSEKPYGEYLTFDEANVKREGLRVPTNDEYRALEQSGSMWAIYHGVFGRVFGGKVFIPAGGCRNNSSGAQANVGTYGYSWSSAIYGAAARYSHSLSFSATVVNPSLSFHRAFGFPVRCVQE